MKGQEKNMFWSIKNSGEVLSPMFIYVSICTILIQFVLLTLLYL